MRFPSLILLALAALLPVAAGKPYVYVVKPKGAMTSGADSITVDVDVMLKDPDGVASLVMTVGGVAVVRDGSAGKLQLAEPDTTVPPENLLDAPTRDGRFQASLRLPALGEHELRVTATDATGTTATKTATFTVRSKEEVEAERASAEEDAARAAAEKAAAAAKEPKPPLAYAQRATATVTDRGGRKVVEAVDQALDWLVRHQDPKGFWGSHRFVTACAHPDGCAGGPGNPAYDVGLTGLTLLAFLGAGHTHQHGEYPDTVERGLRWLVSVQDGQGGVGPRTTGNFTYSHAIASQALFEAYAMTRDPQLELPCRKALAFTLGCQNPYRAWRYGVRPGDNDTSVTAWMMQTLDAARTAGFEVSKESLLWALDFIETVTDDRAHVGYTTRGIGPVRTVGFEEKFPSELSEALTAAGMLCHVRFAGLSRANPAVIEKSAHRCLKLLPEWGPKRIDLYYWYYGTYFLRALDHRGWSAWQKSLHKALLPNQRKGRGCAVGSWDPIGAWGEEGGRVYTTTINTLCLLAPVRYELEKPSRR